MDRKDKAILPMMEQLERSALLSPYPPSFDGNPWSYGFALFSLTLICALSIALLMQFLFEARARRAAWRMTAVVGHQGEPGLATPLGIHRMIITGFVVTILIGALPDVLVLFAWGEATMATMDNLFLLDRIGDGLTFAPFSFSCALSAWGLQVLPQQLVTETKVQLRPPTWRTLKGQAKIIGMILVVAAGVTFAKATAGA